MFVDNTHVDISVAACLSIYTMSYSWYILININTFGVVHTSQFATVLQLPKYKYIFSIIIVVCYNYKLYIYLYTHTHTHTYTHTHTHIHTHTLFQVFVQCSSNCSLDIIYFINIIIAILNSTFDAHLPDDVISDKATKRIQSQMNVELKPVQIIIL